MKPIVLVTLCVVALLLAVHHVAASDTKSLLRRLLLKEIERELAKQAEPEEKRDILNPDGTPYVETPELEEKRGVLNPDGTPYVETPELEEKRGILNPDGTPYIESQKNTREEEARELEETLGTEQLELLKKAISSLQGAYGSNSYLNPIERNLNLESESSKVVEKKGEEKEEEKKREGRFSLPKMDALDDKAKEALGDAYDAGKKKVTSLFGGSDRELIERLLRKLEEKQDERK